MNNAATTNEITTNDLHDMVRDAMDEAMGDAHWTIETIGIWRNDDTVRVTRDRMAWYFYASNDGIVCMYGYADGNRVTSGCWNRRSEYGTMSGGFFAHITFEDLVGNMVIDTADATDRRGADCRKARHAEN